MHRYRQHPAVTFRKGIGHAHSQSYQARNKSHTPGDEHRRGISCPARPTLYLPQFYQQPLSEVLEGCSGQDHLAEQQGVHAQDLPGAWSDALVDLLGCRLLPEPEPVQQTWHTTTALPDACGKGLPIRLWTVYRS